MDAAQRAGHVADQMEIVERQNGIKLPVLRRKRLRGRGAEDKRRDRTGGTFLLGNRDHFSGNIRRK